MIAVYPEGWHMLLRDLNGHVVVEDIAAWTLDPAAPLPSGADRYVWSEDPDHNQQAHDRPDHDDPNHGETAGLAEAEGSDTVPSPAGP